MVRLSAAPSYTSTVDSLRRLLARWLSGFPPLRPGRFGWGAAQLTGATVLSRAMGFVYSAAVMRLAGPEAVGLFRVAWPLFGTAFTLATSGVPYAMAKLLAEQADGLGPGRRHEPPPALGRRSRAIAVAGLAVLAATSSLTGLLLWAAAPWLLGQLAREPRATAILQLLAPSLLLAALASGCRALFEGARRMAVPAASLLTEQAVLAGSAILWVLLLHGRGAPPEHVASALALASVVGEAAGLVVLALFVNRLWRQWRLATGSGRPPRPAPESSGRRWALRAIVQLSLPVAGGRVVASVGGALNSLILPNRLQAAGLATSQAAAQIGLLRGVALPIVFMPNMLSLALMTNLVPSISRAMAQGRVDLARVYSDKATAATVFFALPVVALLTALPEAISRLLYAEAQAAPLLLICALAAPFVYLGQTQVGVLRGLGRPEIPVQAHLAGLLADTVVVSLLAGQPSLGVRGGAWAAVAGYATAWAFNHVATLRRLGTDLRPAAFALPLAGAGAGSLLARMAGHAVAAALGEAGQPLWTADLAALACGGALLAAVYLAFLTRSPAWRWLVER